MGTVVVTGAGSGIGLEIARHFAQRGDSVYAGIRSQRASATLQALATDLPSLRAVQLDVQDAGQVAQVRDLVQQAGQSADVVVNNAGVHDGGSVEGMSEARVAALFATNYLGAARVTRAFLPGMRAARRGTIVNISSIAARFPTACSAHYSASKAALEAYSEALAQEVAALGIRVVLIVPGPVRTGIVPTTGTPTARDLPAYAKHQRRLARRRQVRGALAVNAQQVATIVADAVDSPAPPLRWPVGPDATGIWSARQRTCDEDWIRCAALEDDEAYYDEAAKLFGLDLHRS